MKTLWVTALVGLSLLGAVDAALAQRDSRDDGYEEREYGNRSYERRDYGRRDRSYDDDDRPRERSRGYDENRDRQRSGRYDDDDQGRQWGRGSQEEPDAEFDEDEYLRCNPDVRRAVKRGEMASGEFHYRTFGRNEKRQITCPLKV
nr:hypothetical protein [Methylobacterium sp. 37f]